MPFAPSCSGDRRCSNSRTCSRLLACSSIRARFVMMSGCSASSASESCRLSRPCSLWPFLSWIAAIRLTGSALSG